MGAIASPGSDFGGEFGDEYGDDVGDDDYGDDYGYEFGDEYGDDVGAYEFGAAAPAAARGGVRIARPLAPPPALAAKMWAAVRKSNNRTASRTRLIEPNRGSKVKIERYAFSINAALVLGVASPIVASGQPDTNIRPQRVTMNAPANGFALINEIKVANVSVTVGGIEDAFDYNALGVGQSLDMPTLTPANRASVLGNYTGFVPPGYVGGGGYVFAVSFKGPASIVA
jgi:hypothetical protein